METESETSSASAIVKVAPPVKAKTPLLSDSIKRPFILVWVAIVPQVVLLLLNLRDYRLVVGEMTPWQRGMAHTIGTAQLGLLVGVTALAVLLRVIGRKIAWPVAWALLISPILYLWLFVYQLQPVIPNSVTAWILPPEQVLYDQFAFMMPLMFYAAVRIACVEINITRRIDWIVTAGLALGVPLFSAGFIRWAAGVRALIHLPQSVIIGIFVAATVICIAALLRLVVIAYMGVRRKGPIALAILSFLVGIAGPIGGLLVNRQMPFPADFQALSVYVLALVNGGLLLLPNFRNPLLHRTVWLGQCLLFPFTFYFFLVFLPFLPLSLPAILAVGTGFLVMTPTVLFLVHGQRIYDGYRDEIRDGSRIKPAILGLIALSILPAWYAIQAGMDRLVLRQAIDYVYSPDYRKDIRFPGNPNFVHRSLEHLRDAKRGLDLPFLSRFYSWAVFDGLVLPDDKMNEIHRAFFGVDVPAARENSSGFFSKPVRRTNTRPTPAAVPHDVSLTKTAVQVQPDGNCHRATVSLQMESVTESVSEFATSIELPEGVLVSGFWLHIGPDRVPGQVFEKKTALWVYDMIRDRTRRDPGILLYKNPHTLELRIYPFAPHEQRKVEIEFLYPATMNPAIAIGGEKLRPSGENAPTGVVMSHLGDSGPNVWLGPDAIAALPKFTRTPYLHFLIDRSAGSDVNAESLKHAIAGALKQFPDAGECLVTAVNYEISDLTNNLKPIESASALNFSALPCRGGFMADRAMKRALLAHHDESVQGTATNPLLTRFPIFVLVQSSHSASLTDPDITTFAKFAPDLPVYYVSIGNTKLEAHDFTGKRIPTPSIKPVVLLKAGNAIEACPATDDQSEVLDFAGGEDAPDLTAFDQAKNSFVPVPVNTTVPSEARYAAGLGAWRDYLASIYNPSSGPTGFSKVVRRSRDSGILVGSTSYIVVENSAQWKMLERKQKQKLGNESVLEFEAVPEPSTWCLIIVGGGMMLFAEIRRKRRCI